jgi:hypothetical protein
VANVETGLERVRFIMQHTRLSKLFFEMKFTKNWSTGRLISENLPAQISEDSVETVYGIQRSVHLLPRVN